MWFIGASVGMAGPALHAPVDGSRMSTLKFGAVVGRGLVWMIPPMNWICPRRTAPKPPNRGSGVVAVTGTVLQLPHDEGQPGTGEDEPPLPQAIPATDRSPTTAWRAWR